MRKAAEMGRAGRREEWWNRMVVGGPGEDGGGGGGGGGVHNSRNPHKEEALGAWKRRRLGRTAITGFDSSQPALLLLPSLAAVNRARKSRETEDINRFGWERYAQQLVAIKPDTDRTAK